MYACMKHSGGGRSINIIKVIEEEKSQFSKHFYVRKKYERKAATASYQKYVKRKLNTINFVTNDEPLCF